MLLIFNACSTIDNLDKILDLLKNSCLRSVEVIFPRAGAIEKSDFFKSLRRNNKIAYLLLYGSETNQIIKEPFMNLQSIIETKKTHSDIATGHLQDESNFNCSLELFIESQEHHTYFNKKLFINQFGQLKNARESDNHIGELNNYKSANVLLNKINSDEFQKLWRINKNSIEICNICEFRNVCVDNRLPIKKENNNYYCKRECNYNPLIAKWKGQSGYKTIMELKFSKK